MNIENTEDAFEYLEEDYILMTDGGETPEKTYRGNKLPDGAVPESPKAKILGVLISEEGNEITESDLERFSGIEASAEHTEYLDKLDFVDAGQDSYSINTDYPEAFATAELRQIIVEGEYPDGSLPNEGIKQTLYENEFTKE